MTATTPAVTETKLGVLARADEEDLASIQSIDDAIRLLQEHGIEATDITDLGDGFKGVEKKTIVNIPLFVIDWTISFNGKYTDENGETLPFVIVRAITSDGRKVRFTDGGSGIAAQVLSFDRRGVKGGVRVDAGLTVSTYDYYDDKGVKSEANTYYLGM